MLIDIAGGLGAARSPTSTNTKKREPLHCNLRSQPSHPRSPPMANPSHLRPSWRQIKQALSSPHPAYIARANPSTSCRRGASLRPFHTTPTQSARPRQSPSVRRANASSTPAHLSLPHTTKGGQRLDRDGFWWARIGRDPNPMLEDFAAIAPILYQASSNHGLIPPSVTFNTYKNVSEQLITLAYTEYAGAFNIKTVSTGTCWGFQRYKCLH